MHPLLTAGVSDTLFSHTIPSIEKLLGGRQGSTGACTLVTAFSVRVPVR